MLLRAVRYVVTLDADTRMGRGTVYRLVGTMAHPLNQAIIDPEKNIVVAGYGSKAVAVLLGVYAGRHQPTGLPTFHIGFPTEIGFKSWITTVAVVLALFQLWSSLRRNSRRVFGPTVSAWASAARTFGDGTHGDIAIGNHADQLVAVGDGDRSGIGAQHERRSFMRLLVRTDGLDVARHHFMHFHNRSPS